jgi:selenide,water dikinase
LTEAGCTLVGGHSIDDTTPKFGFAITGTIHPDKMITNAAAQPGDRLVLTKALGTGLIATAIKNRAASAVVQHAAIASMTRLNASASKAAINAGVRAGTDVTGFGLLGHLAEMLRASSVSAVLDASAVPVLEGVAEIVADGHVPGGTKRNYQSVRDSVDFGDTPQSIRTLLVDAQTSGGLLLAVPEADLANLVAELLAAGDLGAVVGRIEPSSATGMIVVR